jgi:hypothetical protein
MSVGIPDAFSTPFVAAWIARLAIPKTKLHSPRVALENKLRITAIIMTMRVAEGRAYIASKRYAP